MHDDVGCVESGLTSACSGARRCHRPRKGHPHRSAGTQLRRRPDVISETIALLLPRGCGPAQPGGFVTPEWLQSRRGGGKGFQDEGDTGILG
jgi:hypothetical protein